MIDLIKDVKNIASMINPKRERVNTSAKELKERLAATKVESKNEAIKATKENILSAANKRLENFEHKSQKEDIDYRDLTVEVTHAKYNASLLELDSRTMQYTIKRNIDLSDAVNKSREYKKRLKSFLTACAAKDSSKLDKALAALQQHCKASQCESLTVTEIQGIMNHATPTQASYFKNFASAIGFASASRSNSIPMEFDKEHEVYKDFIAL